MGEAGDKVSDSQILIVLVVFVAACLAALIVGVNRARRKRISSMHKAQVPQPRPEAVSMPTKPEAQAGQLEALRQNLRLKVMYDEAKIDRMIEFERDELKLKGQREDTLEELMARAIARWEQEN
jgi:hypothetical protein